MEWDNIISASTWKQPKKGRAGNPASRMRSSLASFWSLPEVTFFSFVFCEVWYKCQFSQILFSVSFPFTLTAVEQWSELRIYVSQISWVWFLTPHHSNSKALAIFLTPVPQFSSLVPISTWQASCDEWIWVECLKPCMVQRSRFKKSELPLSFYQEE